MMIGTKKGGNMKKKKFSLLLNIATICLCLTAIAFGVYSAKNASLNVSGTVGFNAHNCKFAVTGTVECASTTDNTAVIASITKERKEYEALGNTLDAYDLGALNFNDIISGGNVVTISLKIENLSNFNVGVKITQKPTFEDYSDGSNTVTANMPEDLVIEVLNGTKAVDYNQVVALGSMGSTASESGSGADNVTLTIKMTIPQETLDNVQSLSGKLNVDLKIDKYDYPFTVSTNASEPYKLGLTMGHNINDESLAIDWFAFAVREKDGAKPTFVASDAHSIAYSDGAVSDGTWYSMKNATFTGLDTSNAFAVAEYFAGYDFWFLSKHTLGGKPVEVSGISDEYNRGYFERTTDYGASDNLGGKYLKDDLTGETFVSQTGMADEVVYESISARMVKPIVVEGPYSKNGYGTTVTNKFWLLSWKEIFLLGGENVYKDGDYYYSETSNDFIATRIEDDGESSYWFRDANGYRGGINWVDFDGCCRYTEFEAARANIRPAFQISL